MRILRFSRQTITAEALSNEDFYSIMLRNYFANMASDEQFSLCWNNFHANMSAGFHGLLSRGDLVDVTLAAEGRLLQAHKLVLSVCSPYFQEMFKMNPTQHPIVFLKDVSHSALRDLLQFMYQGEVNVKQEELASFISTAEQLQVKGLTGNQNEESSTPSKPKPTSRPGPRSSQQRQSVMTKIETDLDSKPSSTPVAVKRPNRPSIASNNSSSSQSGPAKRKCVDPLEAGPSGSAKEEFVTIPDEDENAVAPKMEPEYVNESVWDDDDDGANNEETNFGEDDSNMEMSGFDGSTTDANLTGTGEGGAVGDAQGMNSNKEGTTYVARRQAEQARRGEKLTNEDIITLIQDRRAEKDICTDMKDTGYLSFSCRYSWEGQFIQSGWLRDTGENLDENRRACPSAVRPPSLVQVSRVTLVQYNARNLAALKCLRMVQCAEMMANDIKTILSDCMAGFESSSIALDERTDLSDTAQLVIFIRGVDKEFTVTEKLLALQPLKGTTTGEDIFNEV
ncbi:Modifier of mdg4 [Eumeta japonica]|uniref:Modifier of mdg4 n=1 Tax=Eumeta variegata TaxID=151549 RepID=A0A4C1UYD8_EUMVA|nr:Modifier of mdg4 [Eumeta japonica]